MSLLSQLRGKVRRFTSAHGFIIAAALVGLVLARSAPPGFPHPPRVHATAGCVAPHPQRPCFDGEGSQWLAPAAVFLPEPPRQVSAGPAPLIKLLLPLSTKGSHYNRPPPLG